MSKPNVQKVPSADERKLPIFEELDGIVDRVRVRAFHLFAKRGFAEGHDVEDWLAAQREICWPAAELIEEKDEFEIKVALPGFEAKDITVTATPRELIVKASRKESSKQRAGVKVCWSDLHRSDVYRQIELPVEIDVDKIDAEFANGILEIEAHKRVVKKPKRRNVKVSSAA